jgi:hypothetical membrane protein
MLTRNYLGFLAPLIAFGSILVSITTSPWFDWAIHDLSHLGMYENGFAAALIFNGGLIVTGIMMVVGFLLSFPVAMCIVGISWVRYQNRSIFALVSLVVGSSLILMWVMYLGGTSIFLGAAIPETLTAIAAAVWLWLSWSRFREVTTPPEQIQESLSS